MGEVKIFLVSGRKRRGAEFVCDRAVAAAAGHFALTAPFAAGAHPALEMSGWNEADEGLSESAAHALGFVVLVEALQFDIQGVGEERCGRRGSRVRCKLEPPFVAPPILTA